MSANPTFGLVLASRVRHKKAHTYMSNNKLIVNTPIKPSKNHAPRIAALFFTLLMSVICFPVFAQTDSASSYEKALEQLVEIRDANIAKELALIEESYDRETRDLLRITMQIGNLETANKVKRMLENPDKKAAQYGETTNSTQEKAVVRLMEQREKQIAQATAPTVPIQKWFKESSERLVRKAVQAGDLAVANKLKAMIDQAGGAAGGNKVSGDKNIVVKAVQPSDLAAANKVKVMIDQAGGAAGENTVSVDKNMVLVEGGTLPSGSRLKGQIVSDFEIGKHEVTWGEWQKVRDWAVTNGYDLKDVGQGLSESHPVTHVSWSDVVKWCNAKSEKEGKTPVYQVSGTTYKTRKIVPTVSESANGYRLPSEKEWEWAARGGKNSKGYAYAGSNDLNAVGWFETNSEGKTHKIGGKLANELEIYDMSGNVWEWCFECFDLSATSYRRFRGGSWGNNAGYAAVANRDDYFDPDYRHAYIGFRLVRSSGNKVKAMIDPTGGAAGENTVSVDKNMVLVEGGTLPQGSELQGQVVSDFEIGKHELTWGEWQKVRVWAVANGYDLKDVGQGLSESHPVTHVNWYDVVKWCNAKSEKEGKTPVYQVSGSTYKTGETVPTVSESANGYRLPSEKEWEWAARGGKNSKGYAYAGSNDLNAVGWFETNSEGKTHKIGGKLANELEIYDMSGNVWEWCFDLDGASGRRSLRGASWMDDPARCAVDCPHSDRPHNRYPNVSFRLARSSGN